MAAKTERAFKIIADNRKARFNYEIGEVFEAGIALTGTEVKSLRPGKATIAESYAGARDGELWLYNANIPEYLQASRFNHAPKRPRRLLLHKREINKLTGAVEREGMTLVPLKLYFNEKGRAKIEIAVARGKKLHDKRETEKKRDLEPRAEPACCGRKGKWHGASGEARSLRDPRLRVGALERVLCDVLGAELIRRGERGWAYRFGDTQLNLHGPGVIAEPIARIPVMPGNSDLCFEWKGPIADAVAHLRALRCRRSSLARSSATAPRGRGTSVYFRDPDGSLLEVHVVLTRTRTIDR